MISAINSTSTLATKLDTSKMKARQEEMFAKMDTDGNGTIDKAEFAAFAQQAPQTNSTTDGKPSAEEMFTQMDTDGDGSVSKAEFEAFKPPKPPEAQGAQGQGDLSKMFSKIDTDGNGTISKSEFETFLEQMQEQAMSPTTDSSSSSTKTLADYLNQSDSTSSTTYQSTGLSSATTSESVLDLVG
jgi:Ca2+-binding EF-hand superfamily protein